MGNKNRRAESAINQIFSELLSIPVLVLETQVEESFFNINIGFWNNDFDDARFETVVRKLRWQDTISEIYQNLFQQWQQQGKTIETELEKAEFSRRSGEIFLPLPNNQTLQLVWIPAGVLKMEGGYTVNLSEFRMGKYPVTQAQYQAVMGTNPSNFSGIGKENHPVERVNWHQATEFCQKLTEYLNKRGINVKIALPSETQWEYACRAGTTTKFWFGNSDSQLKNHAWNEDNSNSKTHSVIEKEHTHTNPWGLVDMHGNVWEWCADSWTTYVADLPKDGKPYINTSQSNKLIRGGSWFNFSNNCASGYRNYYLAGYDNHYCGFRVVCV
ncbi:formylglycine-generating enzyme family protein [Sphaerospermopsis sp. LEGE 08334]|uniref:formylglycine-generating enzyme family protein n=1 Tax=Sphaerospermopsis sp. LEGE 08334 TaxID=1828651 RepID=UPI001D1369C7|nr:formylglycine-generating enzyme family protein [Sphaerospermopsis sp. LEGE 08334]